MIFMGAHVEMVMGVVRWGKSLQNYGDAYEFAASVVVRDGVAEIIGATGSFSLTGLNDIRKELYRLGIKRVRWERKSADGSVKNVRVKTIPPSDADHHGRRSLSA